MKQEKRNCPICGKSRIIKQWKARKGVLKGHNMCSDIFCSKKCRRKFKLLIILNDVLEELDK